MSGTRQTTEVRTPDGTRICVEAFGDPADPAILLIGGATWSMDWWEDALCERLAGLGRLVVRYDQRDTGRTTSWPAGAPGYTSLDLVSDAVAILDALGVERAHLVGLSMGGGVAQRLALAHRHRLETLTLIATTAIDADGDDLPGPTPEVQATFADEGPEPDWADRDAFVAFVVAGERPYAGPGHFDEPRVREIAGRVFDRTDDVAASMVNHFVLQDPGPAAGRLADLADLPTLVVHGTADPLFPLAHGQALAERIPGARLVELADVGHQLPPPSTWELLVERLARHTEGG